MEVIQAAMLAFPSDHQRFTDISQNSMEDFIEKPERRKVPNHLLESKIYTKLHRNKIIESNPGILHFGGFEIGKRHQQSLKLINISSEVMNIHIIPPQTKHFRITYTKSHRLIPGFSIAVTVQFFPDEWRYYYDCVRVHCKEDETLLIPLHGYPVTNQMHFPSQINLSDVPLGHSKTARTPLQCSCPIDFEFCIECTQPLISLSLNIRYINW
ncbi:hypothetical protein GDO86_016724 [Hymenochirus boettgeri]|uniref:Uncharacterized protein n=1 Tax=Hymenochirus boettgeri TaxID=247094 RepID=A0A8T2IM78_9PIPI|nr:hypothetical protein GDO86_016724 [Hymenochirus boettgeri]